MATASLADVFVSMGIPQDSVGTFLVFFVILLIWSFVWKGLALWKSARKKSLVWFILLLIINTAGILEILYIFVFSNMEVYRTPIRKRR